MKCANCEYNDGMVYTSIPPKYRCTITNEFHLRSDDCNVEFAPVKHGRWSEKHYCSNLTGYDYAVICSECEKPTYRQFAEPTLNYCPNCGAKMDEVEE